MFFQAFTSSIYFVFLANGLLLDYFKICFFRHSLPIYFVFLANGLLVLDYLRIAIWCLNNMKGLGLRIVLGINDQIFSVFSFIGNII